MYTVTLNELKAVLKMSTQAGQSGVVKKKLSDINGPGQFPGSEKTQEAYIQ
jgi:hypothetical protein